MEVFGIKTSFFIYSLFLVQIHALSCDKVVYKKKIP